MQGGEGHSRGLDGYQTLQASNNDSNLKFMLFKVLSALKHFYSFKELENRLGVSAQILWRYVSLRSVPERGTAEKLIQKIEKEGLIDEALKKSLQESDEPWQILSNPGVMTLAELKAMEIFRGEKVNVIITGKDGYSTAFGAMLADAFHSRLCLPSNTPYSKHVIVKNYRISQEYLDSLIFPKECIPRRSHVVTVLVDGTKPYQLSALLDIVKARQAVLTGVVVVLGSESKIKELVKAKIGIEVPVISLLRFCEQDSQACKKVSDLQGS